MKHAKGWIVIIVLFIIIVIGLFILIFVPSKPSQQPSDAAGAAQPGSASASSTISAQASLDNLISVTAPLINSEVSSPLTITGKARGSWYFEASAPVELLDGNGQVLAQGHITAQGDWMTAGYVPFTASLTFAAPTTKTGTLVLKNDNPSGNPASQKELDIPVTF